MAEIGVCRFIGFSVPTGWPWTWWNIQSHTQSSISHWSAEPIMAGSANTSVFVTTYVLTFWSPSKLLLSWTTRPP